MSNHHLRKMIDDIMKINQTAPFKIENARNFMETVIRMEYASFIPKAISGATGSGPQSFGHLDDLRSSLRVFISKTSDPLDVKDSTGDNPPKLRNHTLFNDRTGSELARLLFATEEEIKEDENLPFYKIIRNFILTSIERIAGPQAVKDSDTVELPDPVEGNVGFDQMLKLMDRYVLFMQGSSGSIVDPEMPYIPGINDCDLLVVDLILQNVLIKKIRDTVDVNRVMTEEEIDEGIRKIYRIFVLDRTCHTALLMLIAMDDDEVLDLLLQAARACTTGPAVYSSVPCSCNIP